MTDERDAGARLPLLLQELEAMIPHLETDVKLAQAQRLEHITLAFKYAEPGGEVGHARRSKGTEQRKKRVHLTLDGRRFIDSYYSEYMRRYPRDGKTGSKMNQKQRAHRWSFIAGILSVALEKQEELSSKDWDIETISKRIDRVAKGAVTSCADVSDGRAIEAAARDRTQDVSLERLCACGSVRAGCGPSVSTCGGCVSGR